MTNGVYRLPADGSLRIWKRIGGAETRNSAAIPAGDYVAPGEYSARDFGFAGDVRVVTYYLEAVSNSVTKADQRILFEVDPDERDPHPSFIAADAVRVTSIALALVPCGDRGQTTCRDESSDSGCPAKRWMSCLTAGCRQGLHRAGALQRVRWQAGD